MWAFFAVLQASPSDTCTCQLGLLHKLHMCLVASSTLNRVGACIAS